MEGGILHTVRNTIIAAFNAFPLIMISFIGFLSVGLGNLGLFVLFIGHAFLVPIAVMISHAFFDRIEQVSSHAGPLKFHIEKSDNSKVFIVPSSIVPETYINVAPSYWMAHTLFMFGYMLANTVSILNLPKNAKLDPILVANRTSRARTVIITTLFFTILLTILRYRSHTETLPGIAVAFVVGGLLGYGWYQFAVTCGVRGADVFGIAQQVVIPSTAKDERPMTCVYSAKP